MTAQSSTNNRFLQYYLYRLGRLRYLTILLSVFALMTFPLYSVLLERYAYAMLNRDDLEAGVYETYKNLCDDLGWKIFALGAVCGLIVMLLILLEGFRYLHRKKYVNMDMALPVTHTQRFFGDLLAVITSQFVPILAACGIGEAMVLHIRNLDFSEFYSPTVIPHVIRYCDRIDSMIPQFIVVAIMLLFMSLFVISFCGRTPIAVMMTVFVQIAIPVITFTLWFLSVGGSYGGTDSALVGDMTLFTLLSPFGYAMAVGYGDMHYLMNRSAWGYLFIAVYMAALCAGSYFVQKHRRTERTGEPFVYRYARHCFTALYILAAVAFFALRILSPELALYFSLYRIFGGAGTNIDTGVFVVLMIVTTLVITVVAELMGGGKPKEIPLTAARYVVTVGLSFGICAGALVTEGFGYADYIPSSVEADSAQINFINYSDWLNFKVPYEEAVSLHKRILAERPFPENNRLGKQTDGIKVEIIYSNSRQSVSDRFYQVDESYLEELYRLYFEFGGFSDKYERDAYNNYTYLTGDYHWETVKLVPTEQYVFVYVDDPQGGNKKLETTVDTDELYAAMQADAAEVDFEKYYRTAYRRTYVHVHNEIKYPEDPRSGIGSTYLGDLDYPVYSFFTRTIALMKEHGIDLFPEQDYSGYMPFIVKSSRGVYPGRAENELSVSRDFWHIIYDTDSDAVHRLSADSPEFAELMDCTAEKSYYTGDERYYLIIYKTVDDGTARDFDYYPITQSNTARAAELWSAAPYADTETANLRSGANIYGEIE